MPSELTCSCGKRLQVPNEFSRRQGQCPACGKLLEIPQHNASETDAPSPSDTVAQAVFAAPGLPSTTGPGVLEDILVPPVPSADELHVRIREDSETDDNAKLTGVGCVLTLLSVAVIVAVAIPIVRWRDPADGQPLPRSIAILSPILIGAAVNGIGTFLLKLIGLPVWSKPETNVKKSR